MSAKRVRQIVVNHREGKSRKAFRAALRARLQMDRIGEAMLAENLWGARTPKSRSSF